MGLAIRVALHMAFSRWGRLYRIISLLSVAGICVAVAALLVVMGVINGFRSEFIRGLLTSEPHVTVRAMGRDLGVEDREAAEALGRIPGVRSVHPYLHQEVLVARGRRVAGGLFKGVVPHRMATRPGMVVDGSWPAPEAEGVAIGKELAARVGVCVGDTVVVATFFTAGEGPSFSAPRVRPFRVDAVLDLGMYQYNTSLVLADLGVVQLFAAAEGAVTGWEVMVEDPLAADRVAREVTQTLGYPYHATSWHDLNRPMFAMLSLQKRALFLILSLMIVVAGANVVSGLTALVHARGRDIGILMAMGMRRGGILVTFVWIGAIIGLAGLATGIALAVGLVGLANGSGLLHLAGDVYQIERLPLVVQGFDVVAVSFTTLVVAVLCTLLPAVKASRLLPIEILRYE